MRRRCEYSKTLNSREKFSNNTNGVLYRSKFCDITLAVIWVTHMFTAQTRGRGNRKGKLFQNQEIQTQGGQQCKDNS